MSGNRKLSRRDFLKITSATAAGMAAGPALKAEKRFLQPFHTRQPVKVVYWSGTWAEEQQQILLREFVDTFNEAHDDIELELTFNPRLLESLQTALPAGEGPDVYDLYGPAWAAQFTDAGFTLPLDDYAEQYGWTDRLLGWALGTGIVKGSLRSVPQTFETQLTDYNKTLFEEHGWTLPTNRAELEAWADDALSKGVFPFAVSSSPWQGLNHHLFGIFVNNYLGGHKFWEALTQETTWDAPEFIEAIKLVEEYLDRGYFMGSREAYLEYGTAEAGATRLEGRGGLEFQGPWMFSTWMEEWAAAGYEWDWGPFPSFGEGVPYPQYNLGIGSSTCVNTDSENPDAAAEVLDWMFEDKARAARIIEGFNFGDFLVPLKFEREDFSEDAPEILLNYFLTVSSVFGEGNFGFTTWTFIPGATHQWLTERFDLLVAGEMSAEEYMQGIQEQYAAELEEGKAIPAPEPNPVEEEA